MIKKLFFVFAFALLGFCASAQNAKSDMTKLPPIIVRDVSGSNIIPSAVMENGVYMPKSRKEIRSLMLSVDASKPYVKQSDGFFVGMWVSSGVTLAGLTLSVLSAVVPAMQNNEAVDVTSICAMGFGAAGAIICSNYYTAKISKAAENYNISVMGFPVYSK